MDRSLPQDRPDRRVLGSYASYPEAERAVDRLSDEGFPVGRTSIVAEGLSYVERVTGRFGYGRAALEGAGQGLSVALLFGLFVLLFSLVNPLIPVFYLLLVTLVLGAAFGAGLGLSYKALSGGTRDFSSVGGFGAERYDVMVDEGFYDEASRILSGSETRTGS